MLFEKQTETQILNIAQRIVKMRSRSNETCLTVTYNNSIQHVCLNLFEERIFNLDH